MPIKPFCMNSGGSSALGPQLAGTGTFRMRRYTLNWPRCWYKWLNITSRRNSRAVAQALPSRPPSAARSRSSLHRRSWGESRERQQRFHRTSAEFRSRLAGCGNVAKSGACAGLVCTKRTTPPGVDAMWICQLARRHRFFVRLPGQLVFRKPLQKPARDRAPAFQTPRETPAQWIRQSTACVIDMETSLCSVGKFVCSGCLIVQRYFVSEPSARSRTLPWM